MRYEQVHAIWDFYDGVRTGVADLDGAPHYFACQFDEGADDYSDNFKLYPIGPEFMRRAMRNWDIYRAWERKFHSGDAELETHPGHGGDAEYDELQFWLDEQIARLQELPTLYGARFRALPGQDGLPGGMLRELEVAWSPSPA
ncbi:hypothetical protein [Mesorhizobium sp. M0816]|uniref:hypothetical protein n=1 Tax=Mesorhizobium sp. M0816 TaxID=2957006 RepID=UPI003334D7F5